MPPIDDLVPRRAEAEDAAQMVLLRTAMLRSMGSSGVEEEGWRAAAHEWFASRLLDRARCAAIVVEGPEGALISGALGTLHEHAPSPGNPTGLHGHVSNVVTLPTHRRLGLGRAVMTALLGWYDTETPARVIDLSATPDGAALYRSLGFEPHGHQALRRTIADGRR